MGNDKTNIFLVAIVGIVAVAGLVFLFSGKGSATTEDSISGDAFWSSTPAVGIDQKEFFILIDAEEKPHIYLYMGADSPTADSPQIKFKSLETGENIIIDYVWQDYAGGVKPILVVGNPSEPCSAEDSSGCLETETYAFKFRTDKDKINQQLLVYRFLENGETKLIPLQKVVLKMPK